MRRNSFSTPSSGRSQVFRNTKFGNRRPKQQGHYIDPQRFVSAAVTDAADERFVPEHRFSDFSFLAALQANIDAKGYEHPTPIQDGAIKPALAGRDIIGLANTGTGKTAAFVLPIIQRLKTGDATGTVLIMAPTRELAVQINDEFSDFARGLKLYSALCVGGANMQRQISQLKRGPHVVIGTPGRLKDLVNQRALVLDRSSIVVLDEADRMLDMGFIGDIRFLLAKLPTPRQSLYFSATITPEIRSLMAGMIVDPVTISVRSGDTSKYVEQNIIRATGKDEKFNKLVELLKQDDFEKVLVFGQTKWNVQRLADNLVKEGITATAIHGNKSQPQRQRALDAFKKNRVKVLVATDVAARGLDIPLVSHVINFEQPTTYDDYIHRIGRTGRAGHRGNALTFVN